MSVKHQQYRLANPSLERSLVGLHPFVPAKQHDSERLGRVFISVGALMVVGMLVVASFEKGPPLSTIRWVLISIWCAILVDATVWICGVEPRHRCPQCRARLPMLRPEASAKCEHQFHCPACDIIWTADVHVGDG